MKRFMCLIGAVAMLAVLPAIAQADWMDNFDSYTTGSNMHGQGGWKGWQNDSGAGAFVTDVVSRSPANSVEITGSSDLVHEYAGYTSGQWSYTAWQYVPDNFSGQSYFILLNTYTDAGDFNWSTQVMFDSAGTVQSQYENTELPLITGRWVEFRVDIDLDADTQSIYYDGALLSSKSWTDGVSGGGALNIGAVDLFANGASPVYYDDISLTPEPASCLVLALGALFLRRR